MQKYRVKRQHFITLYNYINSFRKTILLIKQFSRFNRDLPLAAYSSAEKHNQFRQYYGYHPAATPSVSRPCMYGRELTLIGSRRPIYQPEMDQPSSLPVQLTQPSVSRYHNPLDNISQQAGRAPASLPYNRFMQPNTRVSQLTTKYQTLKGAKDDTFWMNTKCML